MGNEIERKFLVRRDALPRELLRDGMHFAQGYLSSKPSVRVRLADATTPRAKAWLTIKGPGLRSRREFEYEIPPSDAEELLRLCSSQLSKTRYRVPAGKHVWEIDEFTGTHAGLWLAEIELAHEDEEFDRPLWLGDEVTEDPRYTNSALAAAGRAPT
jgi:CYTH domain-containing protein